MAPSYQDKTGPAHNQLMLEIGQTNIITSQLWFSAALICISSLTVPLLMVALLLARLEWTDLCVSTSIFLSKPQ